MYVWGKSSLARQEGLDPRMQKVLARYIQITDIDTTVVEGKRSDEQCYINFGKGRTPAECTVGKCPTKYAQPKLPKVTWLKFALSSNHREGKAVDLYPYPVSLVLGKNSGWEPLFDRIAKFMFQAAKDVGVKIRWGADWDLDNMPRERGETDNPHFEVVE